MLKIEIILFSFISFHYFFHISWPPRVVIPKGLGHNHNNNVQENSSMIMLLDLNHFGIIHNLH